MVFSFNNWRRFTLKSDRKTDEEIWRGINHGSVIYQKLEARRKKEPKDLVEEIDPSRTPPANKGS